MNNDLPKLYVGPMSKNVVDAVLEYIHETDNKVGFIPSRRQIDFNGGYVNNWTIRHFSDYVSGRTVIQRDHGGPGQGRYVDDGFASYTMDTKYLDIVHIDPWKVSETYDDGLRLTIGAIEHMNIFNSEILYEVGTEEAIRSFTEGDLDRLLSDLKNNLLGGEFNKIKYAVVQSGVGLDLGEETNTGNFSENRLLSMIEVCKKYGVLSKEHNGDYLTSEQINKRYDLGLDAINIAPEFGQIETNCYIEEMNSAQLEKYYDICLKSGRWEKWVDKDFKPEQNKEKLIKICGHYVFSQEGFLDIKPEIDRRIMDRIKNRIDEIIGEK